MCCFWLMEQWKDTKVRRPEREVACCRKTKTTSLTIYRYRCLGAIQLEKSVGLSYIDLEAQEDITLQG